MNKDKAGEISKEISEKQVEVCNLLLENQKMYFHKNASDSAFFIENTAKIRRLVFEISRLETKFARAVYVED